MLVSNGLLPIVMGIGLAALSGGTLAASRSGGAESRWREPLFVFAVLLIGLPVFGAALYELGWSIENGRRLSPGDAKAENWLIVALALLLVALAARGAWVGYFYSSDGPPWDRGHLDRLPQLPGFAMASLTALLVGLVVDAILLLVAKSEPGPTILIVMSTLAIGLVMSWAMLRVMTGGNPSPIAHMRSRRVQLGVLSALDGAAGDWKNVGVSAVGSVEPPLALTTVAWITARGMYWRTDDVYALVRYHNWVANHLTAPTPAVHEQRLMLANPTRRAERHIAIKPWTGRRSLWRDALRMNGTDNQVPREASSREIAASLVRVPYEQLAAVGLRLTIDPVRTHLNYAAPDRIE
jgi:hypothetical protein